MRVPESMSIMACKLWAKDYLDINPNSPIDAIALYQCVVTCDENTNLIGHTVELVPGRNYEKWAKADGKRRGFTFDLPVGRGVAPTQRIVTGGPTNQRLDEGYFYQRGDFYTLYMVDLQKPTNAILKNPASGIFQHAVMQWPDGRHKTIGGHFPEDFEIKLFA